MGLYKQIQKEEREKIYCLLKNNMSLSEIAIELGRNKSTISREIRRNRSKIGYLPDSADNLAKQRKNRMISKIEKHPELKSHIISSLCKDKWSPEMITGRMKRMGDRVIVSHETIYKYIYSSYGQKLGLYKHLMRKRPKRQLKCSRIHRRKIADQYKIANRPEYINNRSEFGHFEGDLTFFKGTKSANLAVIVERTTRKAFLIKNNSKETNHVMNNIINTIESSAKDKVKSITFDNGGEFTHFGLLSLKGIHSYFCNPGSPWQKGLVERTNAILHKFIPKSSHFPFLLAETVEDAQNKLNNLPRKCLNFLTPNEAWDNIHNHNVALHL
jgi:IS30 family transposase